MGNNKKNRLLIIGAGGYGRELADYLLTSEYPENTQLAGYLDDNPQALKNKKSKLPILGDITTFKFMEDDMALIAIADITIKMDLVDKLRGRVKFFTLVSERSLIGSNVKIGEGAIICPGAKLGSNMTIGDFVSVNVDSVLGHDSVIGDYCSIMPNVDVGGGAIVGKSVFLATKSVVAPSITVCAESYLGVGSINIKDVTSPGTYFGNPARRLR